MSSSQIHTFLSRSYCSRYRPSANPGRIAQHRTHRGSQALAPLALAARTLTSCWTAAASSSHTIDSACETGTVREPENDSNLLLFKQGGFHVHGDLIDLSGEFLDFVDDLASDPTGSLQLLEKASRIVVAEVLRPTVAVHPHCQPAGNQYRGNILPGVFVCVDPGCPLFAVVVDLDTCHPHA